MNILGDHEQELTADERQAIADEPRPGVWLEEHVILTAEQNNGKPIIDRCGDGRLLDQAQTDSAIAAALFRNAPRDESNDVLGVVVASLRGGTKLGVAGYATDQRGGIHSDPLVRLLAFRAWGDRDRRWFDPDRELCRAYGFDSISVTHESKHAVLLDIVANGNALAYRIPLSNLADAHDPARVLYSVLERACAEGGLPLAGQRPNGGSERAALLLALLASADQPARKSPTPGRPTNITR